MVNINKLIISLFLTSCLTQAAEIKQINEEFKNLSLKTDDEELTERTEEFSDLLDDYQSATRSGQNDEAKKILEEANKLFSLGIKNTRENRDYSTPLYLIATNFLIDLLNKIVAQGVNPRDEDDAKGREYDEVLQALFDSYLKDKSGVNINDTILKLIDLGYDVHGLTGPAEALLKQGKITQKTFNTIVSKDADSLRYFSGRPSGLLGESE